MVPLDSLLFSLISILMDSGDVQFATHAAYVRSEIVEFIFMYESILAEPKFYKSNSSFGKKTMFSVVRMALVLASGDSK